MKNCCGLLFLVFDWGRGLLFFASSCALHCGREEAAAEIVEEETQLCSPCPTAITLVLVVAAGSPALRRDNDLNVAC